MYCAVAGFLLVYWQHLAQRLSVVHVELARLQGHEKVQGMERVELSRLVLQRIYDDYAFVLGESDRAAHMRNVTATAATAHLVFHQILPELYYGVEMANNVSSHSPRPDQFHDLLLALSKKSPGSVGSAQWKFKRESQIRYHTGPPLRLSSTKVLPPTDRDKPAHAAASSAPSSVLSMVAAMLPFRHSGGGGGGGGGVGGGAGSAGSAGDSSDGGLVRGSDGVVGGAVGGVGGGGDGGGGGGGGGGVGDVGFAGAAGGLEVYGGGGGGYAQGGDGLYPRYGAAAGQQRGAAAEAAAARERQQGHSTGFTVRVALIGVLLCVVFFRALRG